MEKEPSPEAESASTTRWGWIRRGWKWVAGFMAFAAASVAVWGAWHPKQKELSYAVSTVPLVNSISGTPNDLTISYAGQLVADVELIQVIFRNTGDIAIRRSDFDQPIRVSVSAARFLGATVSATSPANLPLSIGTPANEGAVRIEPLLLNPGDRFTVSLVVSGRSPRISVAGRIADIPQIRNAPDLLPSQEKTRQPGWLAFDILLGIFAAASAVRLPFILRDMRQLRSQVGHVGGMVEELERWMETLSQHDREIVANEARLRVIEAAVADAKNRR